MHHTEAGNQVTESAPIQIGPGPGLIQVKDGGRDVRAVFTSDGFSATETNDQVFPACLALLPEQDELHLGSGGLNDG